MTQPRPRRLPRPREARFELAVALGVFVVIQAIAVALIEGPFPELREAYYTSRVRHYLARQAADRPPRNVLFLGSSRVQYGVRAAALERQLSAALGEPVAVFNYGVSGAGGLTNQMQWRRLDAAGVRPDLVLVDCVPSLLHGQQTDSALHAWPAGEMDRADIRRLVEEGAGREDLYRENLLARAVPLYGHRLVITSRLLPNLLPARHRRPPDPFKDVATDVPPDKRGAALDQARREHQETLRNFRLGEGPCRAVEGLLAQLRGRGLRALLVTMPEGPTFRSWYRPGAWEEVEAWQRGLAARLGVRLVAAREWVGEEGFFDSHHLTVAGAEAFSARLGREVLLPLLRHPAESPSSPAPAPDAAVSAAGRGSR